MHAWKRQKICHRAAPPAAPGQHAEQQHADIAERIARCPSDFFLLPHQIRSELTIEMFDIAVSAVSACGHAYTSWTARDPFLVPTNHRHRNALVERQHAAAWHAVARLGAEIAVPYLPDAFFGSLTAEQAFKILAEIAGKPSLDPHTQRALHAHHRDASLMRKVALRHPRAVHLMHPDYSRCTRFIHMAVAGFELRYSQLHSSLRVATPDDSLPLRLAEQIVFSNASGGRLYPLLDLSVRHCPWLPVSSVGLAIAAMESDVRLYTHIPERVAELAYTAREQPALRAFFSVTSLTPLRRHFLDEGMTFAVAAAVTAVGTFPKLYRLVPLSVTLAADKATGLDFTQHAVMRSVENVWYVPLGSPVFEDPALCAHALARSRDVSVYLRFPLACRSLPKLVALLRVDQPDMHNVIAAIPRATLEDPALPPSFFRTLQAAVQPEGAVFGRVYRETLHAHPLVLRLVNEPLFGALMMWYEETYAVMSAILPRDLALLVMEHAFGGAGHLRRLMAALAVPRADLPALRRQRQIPCPSGPPQAYLGRLKAGELRVVPDHGQLHDDRWLIGRHLAEHDAMPVLCDTSGPRCSTCLRCRAPATGF